MLNLLCVGASSSYINLNYYMEFCGSKQVLRLIKFGSDESVVTGFAPTDGPRNHVGDRPGTHHNFKGSLFSNDDPYLNAESHDFQITSGVIRHGSRFWSEPMLVARNSLPPYNIPVFDTFVLAEGTSGSIVYPYTRWQVNKYNDYAYNNAILSWSFDGSHVSLSMSYVQEQWVDGTLFRTYPRLFDLDLNITAVYPGTGSTQYRIRGTKKETKSADIVEIDRQDLWSSMPSGIDPLTMRKELDASLKLFVPNARLAIPSFSASQRTDVYADAVSNCQIYDHNMIAYGIDIKNIRRIGEALTSLTKVRNLKTAADAYLANKYGTGNFVRDSVEILSTLVGHRRKKHWNGYNVATSSFSDNVTLVQHPFNGLSVTREFHVKLYYRNLPNPLRNAVRSLYDIDVFPSYENLWDLIPFSFVVDWFVGVSDYLRARDAENYIENIDLVSALETTKYTVHGVPGSVLSDSLHGTFDYVYFSRIPRSSLPPMTPSLSTKSFHNWWEAAALFVQRTR